MASDHVFDEEHVDELEPEGLVRIVVLLPVGIVEWLDERRRPAHTSRGSTVRILLAERRREETTP